MRKVTGDASRNTVVKAIRSGADDAIVKTNFSRHELLRKLQTLAAHSSLAFEESAKAKALPSINSPFPVMVREPRSRSAARVGVENEWDPRLQGIIDHWVSQKNCLKKPANGTFPVWRFVLKSNSVVKSFC
jgi:hypothetical protein